MTVKIKLISLTPLKSTYKKAIKNNDEIDVFDCYDVAGDTILLNRVIELPDLNPKIITELSFEIAKEFGYETGDLHWIKQIKK